MGVALKPLYDSISGHCTKFDQQATPGIIEIVVMDMWQLTIERSIFVRCVGTIQNVA